MKVVQEILLWRVRKINSSMITSCWSDINDMVMIVSLILINVLSLLVILSWTQKNQTSIRKYFFTSLLDYRDTKAIKTRIFSQSKNFTEKPSSSHHITIIFTTCLPLVACLNVLSSSLLMIMKCKRMVFHSILSSQPPYHRPEGEIFYYYYNKRKRNTKSFT